MDLLSFLKKEYFPLNAIEVSAAALEHNYTYLAKSSGLAIAPVLKSNAYGHGLGLVAKVLDDSGAPFFCVDSMYEAYELLKQKVKTPILITGYVDPRNLKVKRLPFSYAVSTKEMLESVCKYQPHAGIHIFIDTGMHREGISMESLQDVIEHIASKKIKIDGLMSHFAASDKYDDVRTGLQVANFQKAQAMFKNAKIHPKWIHMANSSGILNYKKYAGKLGNLGRAGLAIYGIDPEQKNKQLQPVLRFRTKLIQIKRLLKGETVGYDFTFIAKRDMMIGLLPAGYNDGIDRRLSNKGLVSVQDKLCPIIGAVSMNLTAIDLSQLKDPVIGDNVFIFSNSNAAKNSVVSVAKTIDTIPYTVLVNLVTSTKRIVV
jgi:alanine racemase